MNVSFAIAATTLAAAALSAPASAQQPAPPMLLSKQVQATRQAPAPPKPYVSLTTGPEFKRETFVQRFWSDADQRGEGLSKIDDHADVTVLTLGLHF